MCQIFKNMAATDKRWFYRNVKGDFHQFHLNEFNIFHMYTPIL